jgi:ParB family chromosome partitioning protein
VSVITTEAHQPDTSVGERPTISVELLVAHPGNVRTDLSVTEAFVRSIAELGIRVPLLLTLDAEGRYRIIDGHRRLAGAQRAGLTEVPYDLDTARASDEAGQYLDMAVTARHREGLTAVEEADALFKAHEAGASKTRIGKATGFRREYVAAALTAATLTGEARASAAQAEYEWMMDELAVLAEFQDDDAVIARLTEAAREGSFAYQVEYERNERAERELHDKLRATLAEAGILHEFVPPGALQVSSLADPDGEPLDTESHEPCPGHAAVFATYNRTKIVYYCTDPKGHGHTYRYGTWPDERQATSTAATTATAAEDPEETKKARRRVIEGNKAWRAATTVRQKFVATLTARKSIPREAAQFAAIELLTRPEPVRRWITGNKTDVLAAMLGEPDTWGNADAPATVERATDRRLPLLMFAAVAAAHETAMDTHTWRTGVFHVFGDGGRAHAARWLNLLARLGHRLTPIEQAVADGLPYGEDEPEPASEGGEDGEQDSDENGEQPDSATGDDDDPMTRECEGCLAEPGQPCNPHCLSHVQDGEHEAGEHEDGDAEHGGVEAVTTTA